ncbi:hypothetical protein ZWY2020_038847 [Hordeum vulgare]|nr:hypothetical protein ZWY2020_038847 [Hordeum vulgare]
MRTVRVVNKCQRRARQRRPSAPPPLTLPYLFSLLALLLLLALLFLWGPPRHSASASPWRSYTLQDAAAFATASGNGTIILAVVSGPYLPFLSNWLVSVRRAGRANQVLVIAKDYETLERINAAWPGHVVLVLPRARRPGSSQVWVAGVL